VACPCCGGTFRSFRPHRGRAGASCPGCGALERHRLLWLYLSQETNLLHEGLSVLHIAPEYVLRRSLRTLGNLSYLTADLDSALADVHTDVTAMQFADESFDVVLCNHVLEHVDDDLQAMRELHRVMIPGGWGIFMVPVESSRATTFEDPSITDPAERMRAYGQEDHARLYGTDYPDRLRAAGFEVEVPALQNAFSEAETARLGLRRDGRLEDIYVGRRPPAL
jgi:SAM-dependent methyltransferase